MANGNLDYSIPLAAFLATVVDDATYAAIVQTAKTDFAGSEASASSIPVSGGQLYVNLLDDAFLEQYRIHQGAKLHSVDTSDATPTDIATIDTLSSNGDAAYIRATVTGRDHTTPGRVIEVQLGATFYRTSGVISPIGLVSSISQVGLGTATAELFVLGNVISARVTGPVAVNVRWDFTINESRRLR